MYGLRAPCDRVRPYRSSRFHFTTRRDRLGIRSIPGYQWIGRVALCSSLWPQIKFCCGFSSGQIQWRPALEDWLYLAECLLGYLVSNLGTEGAYNIFLPPGVTVSLSPLEASCKVFCDYHNTVNNAKGPFYTVEPYPCTQGCNQCTSDSFDTLTQGLSEEIVELKTDMDPGTGWVIGNEELCDYCNAKFVCNRISTGEYVNAWYDKGKSACWKSPVRPSSELFPTDLDTNKPRIETGS